MLERLTPQPGREPVVAAGAVAATLLAAMLALRFDDAWAAGVRFVVIGAIATVVGTVALRAATAGSSWAPTEREPALPHERILFVAVYVLAALTLGNLADALGANNQLGGAGTLVWVGLVLTIGSALVARRWQAAVMTLLAAASAVVVLEAFVAWVFAPDGTQAFRWVLLLCAIALACGAAWLRDLHRRDAVALVDVAGLAVIAIGISLSGAAVATLGARAAGGPAGWAFVLLAAGAVLIAYAAVDRERVPAFLGAVCLALFVLVGGPASTGGASIVGWPVVLAIAAAALLFAALRPAERRQADGAAGEPPPTAPTAAVPPTAPTAVVEP